ncbi:leucine zipper protein 4 [Rousettus aegyptiacus]|uniref:Leucine zipper protein 4 n=2 Tax=Rousettus aegyptiacus TaxID=9407 RepID=A0A7J8ELG9_ROUAE|nr:leucine zipper protein 4 [Rousettus aegyptiacus]KAF6435912.1 leucine zipper protein 4 [Rousettus aegyptiacus]
MASLSRLTVSGKVLAHPKNWGKMAFLDMSLDDIIILRKIENTSTEEREMETENERENNSVSKCQPNASRHHKQREYSRFKNNVKERNDKKPYQGTSGFKSGQSPLNSQPLTKQGKCNDNSKTQAERNRGQSKRNQHRLEGSQSQSEENRHYSGRSRGHLERSHHQSERSRGQLERSHGQSERSHGHPERSHGQSERFHGQSVRSHGYFERSHYQSARFHGQSGRSHGQLERSRGQTERSFGYSERYRDQSERSYIRSERYRGYSERYYDHLRLSHVLSERSYVLSGRYHEQSERFHGQSGRSYGQSGRYRRHSPVGRFRTSLKIESGFDRSFITRTRNEYSQKQMQQRNDRMNMHRRMSPENNRNTCENYRRRERLNFHSMRDSLS